MNKKSEFDSVDYRKLVNDFLWGMQYFGQDCGLRGVLWEFGGNKSWSDKTFLIRKWSIWVWRWNEVLVLSMTRKCTGDILQATTGQLVALWLGIWYTSIIYLFFIMLALDSNSKLSDFFFFFFFWLSSSQNKTTGTWTVLPHFKLKSFLRCEIGHLMTSLLPWGNVNSNCFIVPRDMAWDSISKLIRGYLHWRNVLFSILVLTQEKFYQWITLLYFL